MPFQVPAEHFLHVARPLLANSTPWVSCRYQGQSVHMIAHVSTFQRKPIPGLFFAHNIQYLNKYLRCERGKNLTPAKQIRRLLKHVKAIFHGEKPSTSLGVCCIGSMFIGGTCCSDLNHRNYPRNMGLWKSVIIFIY